MHLTLSSADRSDRRLLLELAKSVDEKHIYPTLSRVGQATLSHHRADDIDQLFEHGRYHTLMAITGNHLAGYIAWRDGNYIAQLYIANDYQRRGIGTRLLDAMKHRASHFPLQLRSSLNAVEFYTRYGFITQGGVQQFKGIRFVAMEYYP